MLGLGSCNEPVFMKRLPTSGGGQCVHRVRMTAISSTCSPSLFQISEISRPDLPRFGNLNGEPKARPSWPGIVLPSNLTNSGLGSNVSTCDGAPEAKM